MAERKRKKTLNDEKWYPLTALNYLDSQAVNQVITSTKIGHIVTFRVFSQVVDENIFPWVTDQTIREIYKGKSAL